MKPNMCLEKRTHAFLFRTLFSVINRADCNFTSVCQYKCALVSMISLENSGNRFKQRVFILLRSLDLPGR